MKKNSVMILSNTCWSLWNFRRNLIKSFDEMGYNISLSARSDDFVKKFSETSYELHWVKDQKWLPSGLNGLYYIVFTIFVILIHKPKYVCSFTHLSNLSAGIARKFLRFEYIANLSGLGRLYAADRKHNYLSSIVTALVKYSLNSAKVIFVQNSDDKLWVEKLFSTQNKDIRLLPGSGVDLSVFQM